MIKTHPLPDFKFQLYRNLLLQAEKLKVESDLFMAKLNAALLEYALNNGLPAGAKVDLQTGLFSWEEPDPIPPPEKAESPENKS